MTEFFNSHWFRQLIFSPEGGKQPVCYPRCRCKDSLMRTLSSFGLFAAYVLLGVLPAFSQAIPAERWEKFSSPTAGFSILMPGEPQESISENHASAFYAEDVKGLFSRCGPRCWL